MPIQIPSIFSKRPPVSLVLAMQGHREAMREFLKYRGDVQKVLRREVKLMVKEVSKFTPPFSETTSQESFGAQRKVGQNATARDIYKVFRPLTPRNPNRFGQKQKPLRVFQNPNKKLRALLQSGNTLKIQEFLRSIDIHGAQVFKDADPRLHESMRDRRGRVRRKQLPNFILSDTSFNAYVKEKLSHVGKAKSGWSTAAEGIGVSLPAWIKRHGMPGEFSDNTGPLVTFQRIIFGNRVPWIQQTAASLKIMERAFKNRERNLRVEIERVLEYRAKKASEQKAMESWATVQKHYRFTTYSSM